jgi:hypothetical protein
MLERSQYRVTRSNASHGPVILGSSQLLKLNEPLCITNRDEDVEWTTRPSGRKRESTHESYDTTSSKAMNLLSR